MVSLCCCSMDDNFCANADMRYLAAAVCPQKCGFCLRWVFVWVFVWPCSEAIVLALDPTRGSKPDHPSDDTRTHARTRTHTHAHTRTAHTRTAHTRTAHTRTHTLMRMACAGKPRWCRASSRWCRASSRYVFWTPIARGNDCAKPFPTTRACSDSSPV